MHKTLGLIAAAAMVAIAAPAHAESVFVQFGDLNLTSNHGRKALDRRIDAAARQVCGVGELVTGSRLPDPAIALCYRTAKATASDRIAMLLDGNTQKGG
jgi:UrcA family protein